MITTLRCVCFCFVVFLF